jgi:hypothetical protein
MHFFIISPFSFPAENNPDGRRSKWIAKILEFDLEIKPIKLVKG